MASFRQHVTFSSILGAGYAATLISAGMQWSYGLLAGGLCGVAGMLPDLDSDSGKPVRELFGLAAAIAPLLLLHRLEILAGSLEGAIVVAAAIYVAIRFGAAWLFKQITVHRGMFHSLPAAFIAGELAFLAHDCPGVDARLVLASGVMLGFLSHLLLDEVSSVDAAGMRIKTSAGSAVKLFSRNWPATFFTWALLIGLSYVVVRDQPHVVTRARELTVEIIERLKGYTPELPSIQPNEPPAQTPPARTHS